MLKDPHVTIGFDLDGVLRENNKSLGTGDITISLRTRNMLQALYKRPRNIRLPYLYYVTGIEQVMFRPGALESLKLLNDIGFQCYVLTNQEAIGLDIMTEERWENIKDYMNGKVEQAGGHISDWIHCAHFTDQDCDCRKPKPGMFYHLSQKHGVILSRMYYIGDNPSDMEAAYRAGCKYKVHIKLEHTDAEFQHSEHADEVVPDVATAVRSILSKELISP